MLNNLIPFGLETRTGELVDVSDVPSGKGCGCICPSCKTQLIARKGDINDWHFAHLSRGKESSTDDVCDFSFFVSVRMMARQMIEHELQILLPEWTISSKTIVDFQPIELTEKVTDSRLIKLTNCKVQQRYYATEVDIVGSVENIPFGVYFTHPGREVPIDLQIPAGERSGLIAISLSSMPMQFMNAKKEGRSYRDVLDDLLTKDTDAKSWVYHPRYQKKKDSLDEEVKKIHAQSSIQSNLSPDTEQSVFKHEPMPPRHSRFLIRFECTRCRVEWDSYDSTSISCPRCHSEQFRKALQIG